MQIRVSARNVPLSAAAVEHVERRARFALGRFAALIRSVEIRLTDENGPRGGHDKRCRVMVSMQHGQPVVVEGRGRAVFALLSQTIDRAAKTLSRVVKRHIDRRRPVEATHRPGTSHSTAASPRAEPPRRGTPSRP